MGLFDAQTDDENKQNLGLLGLMTGLGMMQANKPGSTMGEAVGAGGLTGIQGLMAQQKMAQQQKQMEMMNQFRQAQLQQGEERMTPTSVREFQFAKKNGYEGPYEQWITEKGASKSGPTSVMQNYGALQAIIDQYGEGSPQQKRFENLARQMNPYNVGDALLPRDLTGAPIPGAAIPINLKPGEQPAVRGAQAEATATGKVLGETQATAQVGLPQVVDQANDTIKLVDELIKHPGMKDVVGMPGSASGLARSLTGKAIPGTDAADFMARIEQLRGQNFLQAYQSLKGGGQITEVEGAKAESAYSRLMQLGQTEDAYRQAAKEFTDVMQAGVNRAKMKAGVNPARPSGATGGWSIQRVD